MDKNIDKPERVSQEEVSNDDSIVRETASDSCPEEAGASEGISGNGTAVGRTTYGSISWLLRPQLDSPTLVYLKMFAVRLSYDALNSILRYFNPNAGVPQHIAELLAIHKSLHTQREQKLNSSRYQMLKTPCFDNQASFRTFTVIPPIPK